MSTDAIRLIMQQYGVDFATALLIYQGMSVDDARAETAIKGRRRAEAGAVSDRYFEWVDRKADEGIYTPSEVVQIRALGVSGDTWDFYEKNIQGTQWDAPPEPPPGRARPAINLGLTPTDWSVLFPLIKKPEFAAKRLASWIGTGYITRDQASAIAREMAGQLPTVLFSWTAEGIQQAGVGAEARRVGRAQVRGGDARPFGIPASLLADLDARVRRGELTAEQVNAFISRREDMMARRRRRPPEPFTEFAPALEELRVGFEGEMPPTERWRDWFRSKFPRLIEQFKGQVPEKERREKGWREFLARQRPEVREQWFGLSPFQRGERPRVFQPRIQTLAF